jgi:hypothetical protein
MADSPASASLHALQSELAGAKTQWEYLEDRLTNGYKDAYKTHVGVLKAMENAKILAEQADAKWIGIGMFVFSVVSVGFAGGLVGGVIAPWVKKAEQGTADAVIRQGIQGIATRTTQQSVLRVVPERPTGSSPDGSPYVAASPQAFDAYLDTKEELDGCFAIVNAYIQSLINLSNSEQWPAEVGQTILDSFRHNCRLLTDSPEPSQLPKRELVARAAEIAMWVAWANARDWVYWGDVYRELDGRGMGPRGEMRTVQLGVREFQTNELYPILDELKNLGISGVQLEIRQHHAQGLRDNLVLDLRKLRSLQLQHLVDLPFTKMPTLNVSFAQVGLRLGGGGFLDGLRDLRPYHVSASSP